MNAVPALPRHTALLLAACLLAACSKINAENYAKIRIGMSYPEVTAILGSPERCDDTVGFKSCIWGDDKSNVSVRFVGEKVLLHSAENVR